MRELILVFGMTDEGQKSALRRALAPQKVMVKAVSPADYGQSVGRLAGDKTLPEAPSVPGAELPQPLLLLSGFSSGRMDQVLTALWKAGVRVDYKAVLTPTNRSWDVRTLFAEIAKEHQQMHGQP